MSYADKVFCDMCFDIMSSGVDTRGEKVRPKWEDGTDAYTIKKFGVVNRYNLAKEFPILTIRPVPIKSCVDEILWIWSKKSNVVSELNSGIWDSWETEDGTIGRAYGYQLANTSAYRDVTNEGLLKAFPDSEIVEDVEEVWVDDGAAVSVKKLVRKNARCIYYVVDMWDNSGYWYLDQVDRAIYDLVNTPFSRRIITNMYNHRDLHSMALYPCAYSMTFNVTTDNGNGLVLNGVLNQRSQDVLVANGWNVAQYAVLMNLIARHCGMRVGELVHVIADAHIYDRHITMVEDLVRRERFQAPKLIINPDKRDFYSFTADDVSLENYEHGEQIKNIPVAV